MRENRFERILNRFAAGTGGYTSHLGAASQLARKQIPPGSSRVRSLWDVAAGVAGPTLVTYLFWVFHRARELGIRRLFFVSRDGQILHHIATRLAQQYAYGDLELRYIFGSRQSWHLPALTDVTPRELAWIVGGSRSITVRSALARVTIEPSSFEPELTIRGFSRQRWDEELTLAGRKQLGSLLTQPQIAAHIRERAHCLANPLLAYLRQQGLLDSVESAIVDVGWTGRVLDSLASFLARHGAAAPFGLYFGLVGHGGNGPGPQSPREGFYLDRYRAVPEPVALPERAAMLEMFCAADHGQVHSFATENGVAQPVFRHLANQPVLDWGLREYRRALAAFVEGFDCPEPSGEALGATRQVLGQLLHEFWTHPTRTEAQTWGPFPFFDDQAELTWDPLASPYTWEDATRYRELLGGRALRPYQTNWEAASLALTPEPLRTWILTLSALALSYSSIAARVHERPSPKKSP